MIRYAVVDSKLSEVRPLDAETVCEEIERVAADFDLELTQRTTLRTKKGCFHWHYKKARAKGVLELTYWPAKSEFLLEIHDNRRAEWNEALIGRMADRYAELFGGSAEQR